MSEYRLSDDMIREFKKEYAKVKSKKKPILEKTKLFKYRSISSFEVIDTMFAAGKSSSDMLQELRTKLNKDKRFHVGFPLSPEYQDLEKRYRTRFESLIGNKAESKGNPMYAFQYGFSKSGVPEDKLESFLSDNLELTRKVCRYALVVKRALEDIAGDVDSEDKPKALSSVNKLINSGVLTSDGPAIDLNRDRDAVELLMKRLRAAPPEDRNEEFCLKLCSSRFTMTSLMIVSKKYLDKWLEENDIVEDKTKQQRGYNYFNYDDRLGDSNYRDAQGLYYVVFSTNFFEFPKYQTGLSYSNKLYEECCVADENDLKEHQLLQRINKEGLGEFADLFEGDTKQVSGTALETDDIEKISGLLAAYPNPGYYNC